MIGQTISHYRVVEKLGGGDTGVVDTTEDVTLHRLSKSDFGSGAMAGAVYRL